MNDIRGSLWRKWDLHVHTPYTKINNQYNLNGIDVWDQFCEKLEQSDVRVIGITDYFSVENYFVFKEKFFAKYPDSTKVFFPNIEIRLNESVNPKLEEVNVHIIFRPDINQDTLQIFLGNLKTEKTDKNGKKLSCLELSTRNDFESASVTRASIEAAFKETFGEKAIRQDYALILAASNNDGIRAERGKKRKEIITDEIDKFCDGFFGGSQNTEYFLNESRLEDKEQKIKEKPVITGCDAHSFDQLDNWLGKTLREAENAKETTWVKADTTYDGLLQIFIEPRERVCISPILPDQKEQYKTISKITFSNTTDFPSEIVFNSNLTSIIGSRSSGKSALLNYIAHAVNAVDTETKLPDGPAANKKWADVKFTYTVEWTDGSKDSAGKVIFLPQNYLFNLSSKPEEVTEKIKPVLFSKFPDTAAIYSGVINAITSCNRIIESSIIKWFELNKNRNTLESEIKDIGDKKLIEKAKNEYQKKINSIKSTLSLTDKELEDYQKISLEITHKEAQLQSIIKEHGNLVAQYFDQSTNKPITIEVNLEFSPSLQNLPYSINEQLIKIISENKTSVLKDISTLIATQKGNLENSRKTLTEGIEKIKTDKKDLIAKNKQNEELSKLIDELNKQDNLLKKIHLKEEEIKLIDGKIKNEIANIKDNIVTKSKLLEQIKSSISQLTQDKNNITFDVEVDYNQPQVQTVSEYFNLKETKANPYIKDDILDISKIRSDIENFLNAIRTGSIKLKANQNLLLITINVLTFTEEIRFSATMEGDKIGGFSSSSMTPGKQALFALTLMLDESNESWPLLVDQPEDDLDSRSIYHLIATYIKRKKKERQIIMVSHNANLVVGADSEQVIIANKHGDDRKNRNGQMFNYVSGALENTKIKTSSDYILEACGIREHACEILDGGEEAFEKRKNKYKI